MQLFFKGSPRSSDRVPIVIAILVGLVLAAAPWIWPRLTTNALANHAHPPSNALHIATMHNSVDDEDICADSHASNISDSVLRGYLNDALLTGNTPVWDGAGSWKINLWRTSNACDTYGYYPYNDWIEVFATAWDLQDLPGFCGGTSCVNFGVPVVVNGITLHHWQGYMFLYENHISPSGSLASRISTINHEFGHIIGLLDPPDDGPCGTFPSSVMHQYDDYGCPVGTYITYPYNIDLTTVAGTVMPSH